MRIRTFQERDIAGLLPLYEDLGYPSNQSVLKNRLTHLLSEPHYGCLVAEVDGEILGFIGYVKLFFFEADGFYYRILALSVLKVARRKGVATQLMDAVKELAMKDGARSLALNSGLTDARLAAYSFYEGYGFEKVTTGFALNIENKEI